LSLVLLTALASPAIAHHGSPTFTPPRDFYLSLGDSMAFGFQEEKFNAMLESGHYTPDGFATGYTDVLADRMRQLHDGQETVNLGCPGETTESMIHGGCEFTLPDPDGNAFALHTTYAGAQLNAAVKFLRSHRHQVSPVTVVIGGGDVGQIFGDVCDFRTTCIERSGLRQHLGRNLDRIFGALRTAAPDTEIISVVFYNPFTSDVPGSDHLWRRFYIDVEKEAARRNGVRIADVSAIIASQKEVCRLTFLCTNGDFHPTDAGYRRIADKVFDAAGYNRL
jgi:lysophospholipase L1-like esterase